MINFIIRVARFNRVCLTAAIVAASFIGYTDHANAVRDMMICSVVETLFTIIRDAMHDMKPRSKR